MTNSTKMSNNAKAKLQEYKTSMIEKAENLVLDGFPKKIIELNELLMTPMFSELKLNKVYQDLNIPVPDSNANIKPATCKDVSSGAKVTYLLNAKVSCNELISEMINIVRPLICKLIEDYNLLKIWISFLIPKIEDGNNFGVSIQENTLNEIQLVEGQAVSLFNTFSDYFLSRAKAISKVAKYPHINDYRQAVVTLDENTYLQLWHTVCEVRNRYSSLHDIITKNIDKLKKPRSCNVESLY